MLSDGYHAVPRGKVATVVTHLETRARPETREVPAPEGWRLTRIQTPTVPWYRALYQAVGADWLWFGRMKLPDAEIDAVLSDGDVHVYALQRDGVDGALMELDFRTEGECELVYFGLIPALIGTGAGRFLMNAAIDAAQEIQPQVEGIVPELVIVGANEWSQRFECPAEDKAADEPANFLPLGHGVNEVEKVCHLSDRWLQSLPGL